MRGLALGVLAVGLVLAGCTPSAPESRPPAEQIPSSGSGRLPAVDISTCGELAANVAQSETGLELTADFADANVGDEAVHGTVTLTNTGESRVEGTTGSLAEIAVARDGVVVWHTIGLMDGVAIVVALEPGESLAYNSSFEPVDCGTEDKILYEFRDDLPALPAARYEVSAAIDFTGDDGTVELITGPISNVTLR